MQKLMLLFFALICFAGANAQISFKDQLEVAKFDIVKKTLEFLSTDTSTFKNVHSNTCSNCKSYEDLKKFATDNNLLNAVKNVIDPLWTLRIDTASDKWSKSLLLFKQQAHDKITTGSGKEKRKKMAGYNDYVASLNKIVKEVVPDEEPPVVLVENPSRATTPKTKNPSADSTDKNNQATASNNFLSSPWIPYSIAAILLGLVIYLVIKNNELKKRKAYYKKMFNDTMSELNEKDKRILELSGKNEKLIKELSDARQLQKNSDKMIQSLEAKKNQLPDNPQTETPQKTNRAPATKPFVQKPKQPLATLKFAKYADMGDGFSNAELLDKPDDETIFEISTMSNNTGEFKITTNRDAQKYALSNAQYFLGIACLYDSFPFENATIQTDSPGTIKLNGGKWIITTPAKISFV